MFCFCITRICWHGEIKMFILFTTTKQFIDSLSNIIWIFPTTNRTYVENKTNLKSIQWIHRFIVKHKIYCQRPTKDWCNEQFDALIDSLKYMISKFPTTNQRLMKWWRNNNQFDENHRFIVKYNLNIPDNQPNINGI